jgi:RND family efflux transporter MFP subunit
MTSSKHLRIQSAIKPVAIALSLALLAAGCAKNPQEILDRPIPVRAVQLGTASMPTVEQFPATLARDRESNVSFRVSGVIQSLNIRAGQVVQYGQSLATLKPPPYVAGRARAEADVNKLQRAAQRSEELLQAGAISTGVREDTDDALVAAKATLDAARYDEESAAIKAPYAGVILSREAEVGETVGPGQRIVRIADLNSPLIAKAAVPAEVARHLHVGDPANVKIWNGDRTLRATIRFVGAFSDSRTAAVTVDLVVQKNTEIASGAVGSVDFPNPKGTKQTDSLLLPPEALLESKNGVGYVYVLDTQNSVARRAQIRVLEFDGEFLRVAGLAAGAKVLTAGAGFVADGQKVQEIRP